MFPETTNLFLGLNGLGMMNQNLEW